MKCIAVIPARLQASRFPRKLLQNLGGKPLIVQTYLSVLNTQLFDQVYVVTDSIEIAQVIEQQSGKVFISQKQHESGSDRIAEAVAHIDADIVVNVQGDEPFVDTQSLKKLLDVFVDDPYHKIDLASLMMPLTDPEQIQDPNNVKVVTDNNDMALYFSRSVIPYQREVSAHYSYRKHIGVYAFRKQALLDFYHLDVSSLEANEKLEQLRYLQNGKRIKMVLTHHASIGVDTPSDLVKAQKLYAQKYNQ